MLDLTPFVLRWISVAPLKTAEQEQQITEATMRGEVHGTIGFHQKISKLISRATKLTAHGGDRKSKNYTNQAGPLILLKFIWFKTIL